MKVVVLLNWPVDWHEDMKLPAQVPQKKSLIFSSMNCSGNSFSFQSHSSLIKWHFELCLHNDKIRREISRRLLSKRRAISNLCPPMMFV